MQCDKCTHNSAQVERLKELLEACPLIPKAEFNLGCIAVCNAAEKCFHEHDKKADPLQKFPTGLSRAIYVANYEIAACIFCAKTMKWQEKTTSLSDDAKLKYEGKVCRLGVHPHKTWILNPTLEDLIE